MYQVLFLLNRKMGAIMYQIAIVIDAYYIKQSSGKKVTHHKKWVGNEVNMTDFQIFMQSSLKGRETT